MKTKLNQLVVSAIIPTVVKEEGKITVKDNVVIFETRKHGSTRMLTKTIPFARIIAMEFDTQGKGSLIYRDDQGEVNFKHEYEPTTSKHSGFVALKRVVAKKESNQVLPTTLLVNEANFISVFEKGKDEGSPKKAKGKGGDKGKKEKAADKGKKNGKK